MLEDSDAIYDVSVADIIDVIKCELGEQVTVTYKEDKPMVMTAIQNLKDQGLYPQKLWEEA